MNLLINRATPADLPALNQIAWTAKQHWNYPSQWMESWRDELQLNQEDFSSHCVFKLSINEEVKGFCAVKESVDSYEVAHLWVLPEHMGRGYGKLLLHLTLHYALKEPKPIKVIADPNAAPFYQRQGFNVIDQFESYPKGRFLPVMAYHLR